MNRVLIVAVALIGCPFSPVLFAQPARITMGTASTVVAIPSNSRSDRIFRSSETVPNSMPSHWRHWESVLNQTLSDRFTGPWQAEQLCGELRRLGLPIVLDRSAIDDSLSDDEIIELKLANQSLGASLRQALDDKNACLVFRPERISIISRDDAGDPRNFMSISYDVSGRGINPEALVDVIVNSIQPDEWMVTGQGLGTIEYLSVRGRDLLIVSQSYQIQLELRSLLKGMDRLTGTQNVENHRAPTRFAYPTGTSGTGSTAITVPSQKAPNVSRRSNPFNSGGYFDIED